MVIMGKSEESVLVVVRCRPLSSKEVNQELESGSAAKEDKDEDKHRGNGGFYSGCVRITSNTGLVELKNPKADITDPAKQFTFDAAYDQESVQKDLYIETFAPLVDSVLEGFNGTIFAYGQTGTGKTFTMEGVKGDPELEGVIPRSFHHIFDRISNAPEDERYLVRASYLEIYQEEIRDLLSKDHLTNRLELRERPDCGVYVKDLSPFVCKGRTEIEHVMSVGNANRTVGATNMNEHSSRSHAIFLVTVERSRPDAEGESHICVGRLNLVDLAGSERQAKTGATGNRLKEATKINLSLSALGNVISALVDGRSSHIPYRDSKLTRLLQDSLGGNAKTIMVANFGPSKFNYDETLTTLRYANRAKNIKNKPRVNEDPKDAMLREFQEEISRLKAQLANVNPKEKRKKSAGGKKKMHSSVDGVGSASSSNLGLEESMEASSMGSSTVSSPTGGEGQIEDSLENRLAIERELLESDTSLLGAEKEKLLLELNNKETALKKEKAEQDTIKRKLETMESKLLSGKGAILQAGSSMVDHTNEQQKMLEKRKQEVAEHRRAQQLAAHELEKIGEVGEEMEKTYTSLQAEVEAKTRKLRKLFTKLQTVKQEIVDVTEEYNRDRRDLEDTQQQLLKELKLKMLIIDNFISPSDKEKLMSRAAYDDETDLWILQPNAKGGSGSAIHKRPVSAAGSRRPMSEYARVQSGLRPGFNSISGPGPTAAALRFKGENIMRLSLDRGGRTTKDYEGPTVAPRVQAALDAAMANIEPDIELDVRALQSNPVVKGTRKPKKNSLNGSNPNSGGGNGSGASGSGNNTKAYPSSRGLVPK